MNENEILTEAVKVLREGGVILYPTDTVWGIGCDATSPQAVQKVYELKRRSDNKALVLLASSLGMVAKYVKEIPDAAIQLVEVNDSPMTIIYPGAICGKSGDMTADRHFLAWNAVGEDSSVGIRVPMSEFCRNLAYRLGRPVVSTSANISGEPAPSRFKEIAQEIKEGVDYIVAPALEKGSSGKASQIIKVGLKGEIEIIRR